MNKASAQDRMPNRPHPMRIGCNERAIAPPMRHGRPALAATPLDPRLAAVLDACEA